MPRLRGAWSFLRAGAMVFCAAGVMVLSPPGAIGAEKPRNVRSHVLDDMIVPGKLVVKIRPGALPGGLAKSGLAASALARAGVRSAAETFPPGAALSLFYTLQTELGRSPAEAAASLSRVPWVEYAEPRYYFRLNDTPNDPQVTNQLGAFTQLNLFAAWTLAKGSASVTIATVDGGTYWGHEDLSPNLWINTPEDLNGNGRYDASAAPVGDIDGIDQDGNGRADDVIGWNFPAHNGNPAGISGQSDNPAHGTATASHSSAATNNGLGMAGSSWNCRLMPINAAATTDNLIEYGAEGIEYASRMGARVVNCSFGRTGGYSRFEQEIIDTAAARGALVVAASGNDNADGDVTPHFPSHYRNVLAVGATGSVDDSRAPFSNYGVNVPVYAPGVNIWSALSSGSYANGGSGTSYSSPLVAGIAGLIRSAHPTWTPAAVAAQLRMTADSIDFIPANTARAGKLGRGRVNAARALSETHAGLDLIQSSILTPSGSDLLIKGDSVVVTVSFRNVLYSMASNITFQIESFDPALVVLRGTAALSSIAPGTIANPQPFVLRVAPLDEPREVVVKVSWVMNGNERDARALKTTLFPGVPRWLPQESPTANSLFSVKAVDTSVVWSAGGEGVAGVPVVIRTTDGGATWADVTANLFAEDFYCIDAVSATHAWVGSGLGRIYATTNGGVSWTAQSYGGAQSPFIDGVRFFDNLNGFALGDPPAGTSKFVLLKTTDGGNSWAHLASEPGDQPGEAGWNNGWFWLDQQRGWIGTNKSRIWRTTNGGESWASSPTPGNNCYGLAFSDPLTGVAGFDGGIVARTTDGGATWISGTFPAALNCSGVGFPRGGSKAWMSAGTKIGSTVNAGVTWGGEITYPIAGAVTHIGFADTTCGWGVTSAGEILRYSNAITHIGPVIPERFVLEQNYPNPFNGGTTIRFDLPEDARVEIVVYDVLGRRVREVVDGSYGPARNEAVFDPAGLASGVYFYRLTAEAADGRLLFTGVKQMVILR